jgi:hypothetical protein
MVLGCRCSKCRGLENLDLNRMGGLVLAWASSLGGPKAVGKMALEKREGKLRVAGKWGGAAQG